MAKYRFSDAQRVALWEAHNKRCFYSTEPLSWAELHIDHILPERLLDNLDELEQIKKEYGLSPEFEINSYYNWVPCHSRYNLKKSDMILSKTSAMFFLDIAKKKYQEVLNQEKKYKQRIHKGNILALLALSFEEGKLTVEETFVFLRKLESDSEQIKLPSELTFVEKRIVGNIRRSDAKDLLHLTVVHGAADADGLQLVNEKGDEITIRTCREYNQAKEEGYYASTTYSMKMESFFNRTCGIVNALAKNKPADKSFISNPIIGIIDLNLIPVAFLSTISPDEEDDINEAQAKGKTIQDWIDEGRVRVKAVSQYAIHLEHSGMGQIIWELMRGDFTGEGIEEILTYTYLYAVGGSFGYGNVSILTRLGADKLFSIIDNNDRYSNPK